MAIEIKFRVWDSSPEKDGFNGLMIDHDYVIQSDYLVDAINGKYPIMQFTGLKDKNGVDIYEGDILKYTLNNGEIRFYKIWVENGGFVINQFQDDFYKEEKDIQFWSGLSDMQTASWVDLCLEVIGNIHQNPELLNQ